MARVEGWLYGFDREDADGGGKNSIESAVEVGGGNGRRKSEAGNLREGVNARVCATGALRKNALSCDPQEGVGEMSLDGRQSRLDLPAVKVGAVVAEDGLPERHSLDRIMEGLGRPSGYTFPDCKDCLRKLWNQLRTVHVCDRSRVDG